MYTLSMLGSAGFGMRLPPLPKNLRPRQGVVFTCYPEGARVEAAVSEWVGPMGARKQTIMWYPATVVSCRGGRYKVRFDKPLPGATVVGTFWRWPSQVRPLAGAFGRELTSGFGGTPDEHKVNLIALLDAYDREVATGRAALQQCGGGALEYYSRLVEFLGKIEEERKWVPGIDFQTATRIQMVSYGVARAGRWVLANCFTKRRPPAEPHQRGAAPGGGGTWAPVQSAARGVTPGGGVWARMQSVR